MARLLRVMLLFAFLLGSGLCQAEVATWTNRDGKSMEAELVGYDPDIRSVTFEKENGKRYDYPVDQLDQLSTFLAIVSIATSSEIEGVESGARSSMATSLFILLGILAIAGLVVEFLCAFTAYWIAARLLTGIPGFAVHFTGFLKMAAVMIVGGILLVVAITLLLASFSSMIDLDQYQQMLQQYQQMLQKPWMSRLIGIGLGVVLGCLAAPWLKSHYEVPFGKAVSVVVGYSIVAPLVFGVMCLVGLFAILVGWNWLGPETDLDPIHWTFDWLLAKLE